MNIKPSVSLGLLYIELLDNAIITKLFKHPYKICCCRPKYVNLIIISCYQK